MKLSRLGESASVNEHVEYLRRYLAPTLAGGSLFCVESWTHKQWASVNVEFRSLGAIPSAQTQALELPTNAASVPNATAALEAIKLDCAQLTKKFADSSTEFAIV